MIFSPEEGEFNYASLALDGDGDPHISMVNDIWDDLVYVHRDGDVWYEEVIDSRYSVGYNSDIAAEADGTVHIIYKERTDCEFIRYATRGPDTTDAPPAPPASVLAQLKGDHVVITWREPVGRGGGDAATYSLFRGTNRSGNMTPGEKTLLAEVDADDHTSTNVDYPEHQRLYYFKDKDIQYNMTCYYYLVSANEHGSSRRSNGAIIAVPPDPNATGDGDPDDDPDDDADKSESGFFESLSQPDRGTLLIVLFLMIFFSALVVVYIRKGKEGKMK
jgi:hypothetical protein